MRRVFLIFTGIYILFLTCMLAHGIYAISVIKHSLYSQLADSLIQENQQIEKDLNSAGVYLISATLKNTNFSTVSAYRQDSEYYSALYGLKSQLQNTLNSMPLIQGLFVFPTKSQQLIYASTDGSSPVYLREWLRQQMSEEGLDSYVSKYWFAKELNGHQYLLRILKTGRNYIGAWTDFTLLLSAIEPHTTLDPIVLFAYDDNHTFTADSLSAPYILSPDPSFYRRQMVHLEQTPYVIIGTEASYTEHGTVYILVNYEKITESLRNNYLVFALGGIILVIFAMLATLLIRKYLQHPLSLLKDSLSALQQGDYSIRLPQENTCQEFANVNEAFNQMVSRIESLKIDIYEEKLNQQRTEMLALKSQVAPHFLINCLNAIYHMSASQNNEGIQKMAVCLGNHLRYALADVSTVPLSDEISQVENYVELSKLRFPGSIKLVIDIPQALTDAAVLPMILLFQVENTIKYEVINGKVTEIHIEADLLTDQEEPLIHFCIWDTGSGYNAEVLKQLQTEMKLNQSDGHNIGTRNTFQRLHLMFGQQFSIQFSNRENAGAMVDITIPYILTGESL